MAYVVKHNEWSDDFYGFEVVCDRCDARLSDVNDRFDRMLWYHRGGKHICPDCQTTKEFGNTLKLAKYNLKNKIRRETDEIAVLEAEIACERINRRKVAEIVGGAA